MDPVQVRDDERNGDCDSLRCLGPCAQLTEVAVAVYGNEQNEAEHQSLVDGLRWYA